MNFSLVFINNYVILLATLIGMPVLLYLLRLVALNAGLVDVPNARKIHAKPVPLIGGLALFIMASLLLYFTNAVNEFSFYLIIATGLVVMVGLLDDIYQLSAFWRFLVQITASLIIIYFAKVQLNTFGLLLIPGWEMNLGLLAIPVTVFGVVGVINALNMADGIDGLAAMTFCLPVIVIIGMNGQSAMSLWLLFVVICVGVFIIFNKTIKYKIFLGDNGSLLLGFILAWLLVYFSQGETAIFKPVTALYLVALPIYDTIFVMLRRILKGKSPFKPDNTHLHHLFLAQGWSQTKVLLMIVVCQAALILLGVVFLNMGLAEYYQFYLFVLMSIIYYFLVKKSWKTVNHLKGAQ